MSTKQGPSCVNTFLMKYRIALRTWMFNSLLGSVVQAAVGCHVVHRLAQWPVLLGLAEEGSCLCLGRFCGWAHPQHVSRELGSCPLTLASPRTVLTVILTEYLSSFEPLLCKLLGSLWNGFDSPERPLQACSDDWHEEKEVAVEWHLPCCPLPSTSHNGINGVLSQPQTEQPQMQLPHHPPTVPVPPGMAAASPPLSSVVGRTQPNPCVMGSFPVSELFGYVNNVVRMSVC